MEYPLPASANCSSSTLEDDADELSEDDKVSSLPSLSSLEEASSLLEAISITRWPAFEGLAAEAVVPGRSSTPARVRCHASPHLRHALFECGLQCGRVVRPTLKVAEVWGSCPCETPLLE